MKYKKVFTDAFAIIVISSILGVAYNLYIGEPKSLPLIYTPEKINTIDEENLFSSSPAQDTSYKVQTRTIDSVSDKTVEKPVLAKDSIKKDNPKIEESKYAGSESKFVDIALIKKHLKDNRILIIDARSPEIYKHGHIGNAINIFPLIDDTDEYLRQLVMLPRDKTIIVYCDGGNCDLSDHIYIDLKSFGFSKIFIYKGGWEEWIKNANS